MSFSEFYARYPRKKAWKDAEKAYGQVTKQGARHEDIMDGLERMISQGWDDIKFVPYPATWLRAWQWLDEDEEEPNPFSERLTATQALAKLRIVE